MADSVKIEKEAVLKFALINEGGTSTTNRSISVANPIVNTETIKGYVRQIYAQFGPQGNVYPNFVQYASFKDEDDNEEIEVYETSGLEAAIVEKTTTTLDWQVNP